MATQRTRSQTIKIENIAVKNIDYNEEFIRFQELGTKDFDLKLTELAESIKRVGLLHPIVVSHDGGKNYTCIAGNRRLMACTDLLKYTHIPCHIVDGENFFVAFTENINREALTDVEVGAWLLQAEEMYKPKFANTKKPMANMYAWFSTSLGLSAKRLGELRRLVQVADKQTLARIKAGEISSTEVLRKSRGKATAKRKTGTKKRAEKKSTVIKRTEKRFTTMSEEMKEKFSIIAKNAGEFKNPQFLKKWDGFFKMAARINKHFEGVSRR